MPPQTWRDSRRESSAWSRSRSACLSQSCARFGIYAPPPRDSTAREGHLRVAGGMWEVVGGSSERRVTNCAKLRPMPDEGLTGSLEGLKELNRCKVDFAEDLPDQRTGEVSPGVEGDCGRASVWVPVEDVTSSLSDPLNPSVTRTPSIVCASTMGRRFTPEPQPLGVRPTAGEPQRSRRSLAGRAARLLGDWR